MFKKYKIQGISESTTSGSHTLAHKPDNAWFHKYNFSKRTVIFFISDVSTQKFDNNECVHMGIKYKVVCFKILNVRLHFGYSLHTTRPV